MNHFNKCDIVIN